MVMRVRSLVGRHRTRCIRVAWRAELTLSLMAMTEVGRGEPSRLMMSRGSGCVMALLGGEDSLVGGGAVAGGVLPGWVVGFLALLVTWAHEGPWVWEAGGGGGCCVAPGVGPVAGGGGGGGGTVASAALTTPSAVVRRDCNWRRASSVARRGSRSVVRRATRESTFWI